MCFAGQESYALHNECSHFATPTARWPQNASIMLSPKWLGNAPTPLQGNQGMLSSYCK